MLVQAGLYRTCWKPHCWFSHEAAQMVILIESYFYISEFSLSSLSPSQAPNLGVVVYQLKHCANYFMTVFESRKQHLRKPDFCLCKTKGTDQLCSNCTADQCLCFCYMDSRILLLPLSEILSLWPSSVGAQARFCQNRLSSFMAHMISTFVCFRILPVFVKS